MTAPPRRRARGLARSPIHLSHRREPVPVVIWCYEERAGLSVYSEAGRLGLISTRRLRAYLRHLDNCGRASGGRARGSADAS